MRSPSGFQEKFILSSGVLKVGEQTKGKMSHRFLDRLSRSSSEASHRLHGLNLSLLLLSYRRIPEHPFPVSYRDWEGMPDAFFAVALVMAMWKAFPARVVRVKKSMHTARRKLLIRGLFEAYHLLEVVWILQQCSPRSEKSTIRAAEAVVDVLD